jgi:radical SAM protein with 4Fe4S-binding SPASM domain
MSVPERKPPRCHIPWQQMVIDSTGSVSPCCYWGAYENDNPPIGNLNEQDIDEIWNNDRFRQLRRGMASGDLELAGCAKCYALQQDMPLNLEFDPDYLAETPPASDYARNMTLLREEIAEGRDRLDARPTVISYTPSHRCNIRCTHCYQESTRSAEISRSRAADEIVALAPFLSRLVAGGGEPFLLPVWRHFLASFDHRRNPYLDFATTTNATIVTDEVLDGLARFKKLTLNVSLDGTGEVFERVRIGARFAEVQANIRRLKRAVEQAPSAQSSFGVSMCVMKSNIRDLPNFVRFCAREGLPFGMSPVISAPPDESLCCFNDPAREMEGWERAIDEAVVAMEEYFPVLARASGVPELTEDSKRSRLRDFDLLRTKIPFHLANRQHVRVHVRIPAEVIAAFEALYPGEPLVGYIFRAGDSGENAPYWSALREGLLRVSLPPGEYFVNFASKWANAGYWDQVRFEVPRSHPPGTPEPLVVSALPPASETPRFSLRALAGRIGGMLGRPHD